MLYKFADYSPRVPDDGDFWVAPGARVIGQVTLRSGASVWFNAVLRGDNETIEVGHGSNIQDNCVLHVDQSFPLLIGAHCTVGHSAILHGCQIADGSLVGMGATVLNGARIGANCLIGAGALVVEGAEVPDGVLVLGRPGKVARDLTPDEIAGLSRSAQDYREKMRRYRDDLRPESAPAR